MFVGVIFGMLWLIDGGAPTVGIIGPSPDKPQLVGGNAPIIGSASMPSGNNALSSDQRCGGSREC